MKIGTALGLWVACLPLLSWGQGSAGAHGVTLGMLRSELPEEARRACPAPKLNCAYETKIQGTRATMDVWLNGPDYVEDADRVSRIWVYLPASERDRVVASLKQKYGSFYVTKDNRLEWKLPVPSLVPKGIAHSSLLPDELTFFPNSKWPSGEDGIAIFYMGWMSSTWRGWERRVAKVREKDAAKDQQVKKLGESL